MNINLTKKETENLKIFLEQKVARSEQDEPILSVIISKLAKALYTQ